MNQIDIMNFDGTLTGTSTVLTSRGGVFVLPQPNTKSLSDVVKSKCEERDIPVQFYRNCFYFVDDETTIQVITDLVRELENERTRV